MSTLYICGDSFCSTDSEYGDNWPEILAKKYPNLEIVNLSSFGASNYLIYLQVKYALEQNCDYLIYHATSAIRQEFVIARDNVDRDNIDRYWNQIAPDLQKTMASISWLNPHKNASDFYNNKKISAINNFFNEFIDLPVLVEKNHIFIQYTLHSILSNKYLKKWAWSRGGFEHKSFNTNNQWQFDNYNEYHCDINLWDYYDPQQKRPYFHITDQLILQSTCNEYAKILNL